MTTGRNRSTTSRGPRGWSSHREPRFALSSASPEMHRTTLHEHTGCGKKNWKSPQRFNVLLANLQR